MISACLLCFDVKDGKFLWQHSSEKLPTGRVHDWPLQGICSTPLVEGNRLWFVTSRGEVRCLDTEGFHDGKNDGPFTKEDNENKDEADVVWVLDMMKELGVSQHNMADCSVTSAGDVLFVCTSNGVDEAHNGIPAPQAPSFIALDKNTGKVLWTDKSPGLNILHGQWSSPAYAVLGGVPQVIFGGGDGWIYSFDPAGDGKGKAKLLWKFDCNPKTSHYALNKATRNHIIGTPVDLRWPCVRRRWRRSGTWRRHGPPVVHRSDQARRREPRAGLQLSKPGQADRAQAAAGRGA